MASFGGLDSVDEHLSCGLEAAEGSVAEQRTGNEAPQISPYSNASAGQVSTQQDNEHSGIEGDCSPGLCDKRSLMQGRDGQCTGNGDFEGEGQNEANASNFGREGLSSEFRVGDLPNGDEMALDLTSGIGCQDNPSENGMCVNVPQLKGIKIVEEKVVIALDSPAMNDHFGSNPIETTPADSVDENVNDVAKVQTDTCNMKPYPQTSEMPRENVLSLGYVDEENTKHEDKIVSGLPIEVVEATLVVDMDNLKLFSNDTDIAADNLCSTDSLCYAVLETVQEDDRSVQCLSSEEASGEKTRKTGIEPKVEAETCIETPFFQVNELPVEEKTVNILLVHEQLSDDDDTGTMCSRINETNIGNILEADSQNDRSILLLHEMPCRQSSIPDCKTDLDQLNEKKADGLLSGMSAEMFSGMNDVKIDEMSCQILPSKDDRGASEGLHDSSLLSNSAQVSDREGNNGAAETNVEHVEEENTCPPGKFNKNSTQSFHFKKLTVNFKSLSGGSPGLQSCEPHPTTKNCSAKSSNDLGLPCEIAAAATTSSAANDDPSKKNDEGKHDGESECVPETESPVVTTSSSGRSSRVNKSGRKTQAKRASRYTKNARKMVQHHEALELIFKAAKKKRTYSSKTARPSTWGVMQNISQYFKHMDVLAIEPAQKQGTRKVRIGYGSGKQRRDLTGETSQASKEKVGGSSNRISLKVKMGKRVISEVVNAPTSLGSFASASCGGSISDVTNLANDFKEKNQLGCIDAMLDTGKLYHSDSLVNGVPNLIAEESVQDGGGCFDPTVDETGLVRAANDDRYLGSETSPDSEVINLKSEAQVSGRRQGGINSVALDSSRSIATCEHVLNARKGKKQDKVPCQSSGCRKDKSLSESSSSSMRSSSRGKVDGSLNSGESLPLFNESDLACFKGPFNIESDANTCPGQDISIGSMHLEHLKNEMLSSAKKKEQKQVKRSKSGRESRGRSRGISSTKSGKGASCKQKKDSRKSTSRSIVKEKGVHNQFPCKAEDHALAVNGGRDCDQKSNTAASMWTDDTSKMEITSNSLVERRLPPRNAWVRCDDCHKWRRIAAQLADSIENSNSKWICKDNLDKRFADCLIPQEMSNADINAELDLSDYSCEDDDYDGNRNCTELKCSGPTVPQQSSFVQIDSNKFLHRSRRIQTIDEVMVCHCRPPLDGKLGCGDECLNRMLNIECVQGTCPCGDLCSNQQFQKRKYAKLQWFRCGKKGYGLQLLEDVSKGKFIIEYVGEVLDVPAHDERQRDYAARGHKHFYFMTLNGSEVIDACIKGNLGRFINHSCDPNCRTEKWMVNGEICIGLFAIRDIKKGEEVTFDYNYVRVFGAAAKKCVCGSPQCRGYIGGDLQSTETIVQGDSDDEFPEPVMLREDGDVAYRLDTAKRQTVGGSDMLLTDLLLKDKSEVIKRLENTLGSKDPRSQLDVEGRAEKALPLKPHQELSVHSKDIGLTPLPVLKQMISTEKDASNLNFTDTAEMSEPPGRPVSDEKWDLTEVHPPVKAPGSSGTVKKGKGSSNSQKLNKGQGLASKSQMVSIKTKNPIDGSANGRFEAVQEKLNELLDADGGISKRKDAPKGYLKLLLLTAASGDSGNGEAIQSNRDLSMILDALIKTRSRVVLMDIINKNGLRMLHNIMKQYRRDFKKIPILRKLLKVLEYLAVREILTLERINVDPPCPGMESFRESILSLTEHDDKQVHQIARNFRDRWIPRHLRKVGCADWGSSMNRGLNLNFMDCHSDWRGTSLTRPVEATNCLHQPSVSATTSSATDNSSIDGGSTSGTQTRKRKTRWDSDTNPYLESLKRKESLSRGEDGKENNYEEDGPPGFSSPLDTSRVSCSGSSTAAAVDQSSKTVQYLRCPFDAVIGQPQERFKSQSPVSYGVPLLVLQQFGTPQAGSTESWAIAPGMPFHPFPPLPPFPRDRKCGSPPSSSDCRTNSDNSLHPSADEKKPKNLSQSTSCSNLAETVVPCSENQQTMPSKRLRLSSHDLGQRYFRQQKWNSAKMPPPWVRNCWRSNPSGDSRPALNEQRSSEDAIDCKLGREDSNYHRQMPPVWNHHH